MAGPDILRIERRNTQGECAEHVGNMVIKIEGVPDFKTVAFFCTKTPGHRDGCAFVGEHLIVSRKPQGLILEKGRW